MWVFGYGSLMWDPGFQPAERQTARLMGWHRSFCMASIHYRGTPEAPGLVLALDAQPHAFCAGVAFRVASTETDQVRAYLHARELVSDAYLERLLPVALADGRQVMALTYVIDRAHVQYRAGLTPDQQAAIIAGARGQTGANRDYLTNTVDHLSALGLDDPDLTDIARRVAALGADPEARGAVRTRGAQS